jgi:hypothetical protein
MGATLLAAVLAGAIYLKSVACRFILIFAANFLFEVTHFRGKELNGTPAIRANHMVMASPVILVLITGDPIVESHLARQTALR